MSERAVLIRLRPGLYRAYSRSMAGRSYKIQVALLKGWGWSGVCNCPGHLSHKHCYHTQEAAEKEYEHMTTDVATREQGTAVQVFERLPVPQLDPNTVLPSTILPAPSEIAAMAQIANLMTPENEDPRETFKKELAGWELGVGPMTAIRRMFTVNGKIEPDTQLMLALAIAKDPTLRVEVKGDGEKCTATLIRDGKRREPMTYTILDATKSGQAKVKRRWNKYDKKWEDAPGPWQLYPADMLRHATIKRLLRLYAPDLINNVRGVGIGAGEAMVATDEEVRDAIDMEESTEGSFSVIEEPSREDVIREGISSESMRPLNDDGSVDTTNYTGVLKALLTEAHDTSDNEWFGSLMSTLMTQYTYAVAPGKNKRPNFSTDKLTPEDAKVAVAFVRKELHGAPEQAPEVPSAEAAAAMADDTVDPDDEPFV